MIFSTTKVALLITLRRKVYGGGNIWFSGFSDSQGQLKAGGIGGLLFFSPSVMNSWAASVIASAIASLGLLRSESCSSTVNDRVKLAPEASHTGKASRMG